MTRATPRRKTRRHRSDPLPPPTRENWLGLFLMIGVALVVPIAVWSRGFAAGYAGMVSVAPVFAFMAYYGFIGLGMWLVRPKPEHPRAFRISFGYLHLFGACWLLRWWEVFQNGFSDPFRPQSPIELTATALTVLAFIPAFVLRKRARDWKMIFYVLLIVPFGMVVALGIALIGVAIILIRTALGG